ncbi:MAG: ribosome assembly RNA-binding protein YhbY [Deltaproteobacteria bacterium]|nr:ribosome assembly RNA-binding protein YhbY [Nannocystaceae bacterium]
MTAAPVVSTRARAHLRSLAHHLEPTVQIGGDGLSESVRSAIEVALDQHELIKVRLGPAFTGERREAARELAESVRADLTQVIGRVIVLYRPRKKPDPKRPSIVLPS